MKRNVFTPAIISRVFDIHMVGAAIYFAGGKHENMKKRQGAE